MNVLILHYTHPEGYPPTLNAINCISEQVDKITVLSTATLSTKWNYDKNVKLVLLDDSDDRFKKIARSKLNKIKSYYTYILAIYQILKKESIDLLIIYDNVPFFFYTIASFFLKKRFKIWYHNHDVYPLSSLNKYSVNWFGRATEKKMRFFNKVDYFSLPAVERKKMYPLNAFKGKFFFIPNYPSKRMINSSNQLNLSNNTINIIYPGSPSHKNGFKELIDVMNQKINNKTITLTVVGDTHLKFKNELLSYADKNNVKAQIVFKKRIPYVEMTHFLKNYQIGWGLYKPVDLSVATAGSSSNKIYEFLANGLPIIVYDNEHHRNHLNNCKAAFFSDLSPKSILKQIKIIDTNITELSTIAKKEFEYKYQFELAFNQAFHEIKSEINKTLD